jgi:hypothetical protein
MSDVADKSGRPALGGGFWFVQALVLVVLVVLAFLVGRSFAGEHKGTVIVDNDKQRDVARQQLATAEQNKTWSQADEHAFARNLAGLSLKTRFELSKHLAHLINTKAVRVIRPPRPADVAICPCTPGLCTGANTAPPTPTAAPTGAAPARK